MAHWKKRINNVGNWEGGGVKNWSKWIALKMANMGEGDVKNPEKMPTSFMDSSLVYGRMCNACWSIVPVVYNDIRKNKKGA